PWDPPDGRPLWHRAARRHGAACKARATAGSHRSGSRNFRPRPLELHVEVDITPVAPAPATFAAAMKYRAIGRLSTGSEPRLDSAGVGTVPLRNRIGSREVVAPASKGLSLSRSR